MPEETHHHGADLQHFFAAEMQRRGELKAEVEKEMRELRVTASNEEAGVRKKPAAVLARVKAGVRKKPAAVLARMKAGVRKKPAAVLARVKKYVQKKPAAAAGKRQRKVTVSKKPARA